MRRIIFVWAAALVVAAVAVPAANADAPLAWSSVKPISPTDSPYAAGCARAVTGINFPGTEVEPWVAVNPSDDGNSVAVWQQDRWSDGGANGLRAAVSHRDSSGQVVWSDPVNQPTFTRCAGGSGDDTGWERASDPWVAFSATGKHAYFMALTFNQGSPDLANGQYVSRSDDGGGTWQAPQRLIRDTSPNTLNDKNALTADRFDDNYAYAIWDRLVFPNERTKGKSFENAAAFYGPTWFARTTDGGDSWEQARKIWDPGQEHHNSGRNDQSIGNQIVQTSNGDLVDVFDWISNDNGGGGKGFKVGVLRSTDHGATWSNATVVSRFIPGTVSDPTTGEGVRSGDIIPEVAADPNSDTVYAVWQGANATSPSSVYFTKSTDAGKTWSNPVIINTVKDTEAFTPTVRVGSSGEVAVTYYDFRNDDSSATLTTDYWSIVSRDGGTSWSESHIDGPFDHNGAARANGLFLGDYAGLGAGNSDTFRAVFGKSTGTHDEPASDIEESDGD